MQAWMPRIEAARGRAFLAPVPAYLVSREQLVNVQDSLSALYGNNRTPAGWTSTLATLGFAGTSGTLARLGLPDASRGTVLGFYVPAAKALWIVTGEDRAIDTTLVHELVHAMQDQYTPLDALFEQSNEPDMDVALRSVIEGEAEYVAEIVMDPQAQTGVYSWPYLSLDALASVLRGVGEGNYPSLKQWLPLYIPYSRGPLLVSRERAVDGWRAVTQLLQAPPRTVEQVLEDGNWRRQEAFSDWSAPAGSAGWDNLVDARLGAAYLAAWLGTWKTGNLESTVAGWNGDRVWSWSTSAGTTAAWVTSWESPILAKEFFDKWNLGRGRWPGWTTDTQVGNRSVWRKGSVESRVILDNSQVLIVESCPMADISALEVQLLSQNPVVAARRMKNTRFHHWNSGAFWSK